MSLDNTNTDNITAEEVFADLKQQLQRLHSAVSHLTISEQAATTAIEAAEQVLQQQSVLGQQLTDYVSKLPQPGQVAETTAQLQKLTKAVESQSQQLEEVQELLRTEQTPPLPNDSTGHEQLLDLTTALAERQERMSKTVEMVGQVVQKGVTHYPSQQLADFLQNTLEPFVPVAEIQPTLVRNQQLLQEIQLLVKGLNASTGPDYQAITKSVQGLSSSLKPEFGQLANQTLEVQKMLGVIKAQLSKPALTEQSTLTEQKVEALDQMVRALTRSAVAQQEAQKRQNMLTLVTLLTALATLAGLAIHFLRG